MDYAKLWRSPGEGFNASDASDIEFQVVGAPSVAYTPERSLNGTDFVACNAYDKDGNAVGSISAAGIYSVDGGAYVRLSGGSGSTIHIRAGR